MKIFRNIIGILFLFAVGIATYDLYAVIIVPQSAKLMLVSSEPVKPVLGKSLAPIPLSVDNHVGPDYLYPNPQITPGKADTLISSDLKKLYNGLTYSKAHRNVPDSEKLIIYKEYSVSYPQPTGTEEVDHFYPVCGGGSNSKENLWLQPAENDWNGENWGFHKKDDLETWVCAQIKAGKLDPKEAFKKITTDWVKFYQEVKPSPQNFGVAVD